MSAAAAQISPDLTSGNEKLGQWAESTAAAVPKMDLTGVILGARSPSGKAVVIQADEDGHVICH